MRIVYLLETAGDLWGGVKQVLEAANRLSDRGHAVIVVSRSGPPDWMKLRCELRRVDDFSPANIPDCDIVVSTLWTTVPPAVAAGRGVPVHFCQGYEGDNPENAGVRDRIEAIYRMPEPYRVTISTHLTNLLEQRFGIDAIEVVQGIDHGVMFAGDPRPGSRPIRVGLVGPYQIEWKDIPTGLEACGLAHRAGLELQVVRITNTTPHPAEQNLPFPVEWHVKVPPAEMGALYRSLDVFLGSSYGHEEGFFLPAIEAMACGIPCVLTDVPCHQGYGEGQGYALFAPARDAAGLAEAVVLVGAHPTVPGQLRENGFEVARQYDYDVHVEQVERAFEDILRTARPTATIDPNTALSELDGLGAELTSTLREAAQAYLAANRQPAAIALLHAAVEIDPTDAVAQNMLLSLRASAPTASVC